LFKLIFYHSVTPKSVASRSAKLLKLQYLKNGHKDKKR